MALIKLSCNSCGAPLQVASTAEFVTCGHCHSQLTVKHSESAHWTEQLGQIDRRTQHLSEQVALLHCQQELDRIDREWQAHPLVLARINAGRPLDETTTNDPLVILFVVLGMGIMGAISIGPGVIILALPAFFLIIGMLAKNWTDEKYDRVRADYLRRRHTVQRQNYLPQDSSSLEPFGGHQEALQTQNIAAAIGASMTLMHAAQEADAAQAAMMTQQHLHSMPATSEVAPPASIEHSSFSMESVLPSGGISAADFAPAMPSLDVVAPSMPSFEVSAPMPDMSGSISFGGGGGGEM